MIISIFGGTVLRPGQEDSEQAAMDRLIPIYTAMPGFISYQYYTGEDGDEISIARFTDRTAMDEWVRQPDHIEVQRMAGDLYSDMWVQTAETFHDFRLVDGRPTPADLTPVFRRA